MEKVTSRCLHFTTSLVLYKKLSNIWKVIVPKKCDKFELIITVL